MAVLPIQPTPFFDNKNRAFWQLNFIGWGGALVLRSASAIAGRQDFDFLIVIMIEMITGFSISLILSVVYRQLINRRPFVTWGLSALALAIAVSLLAFIDSWVDHALSARPRHQHRDAAGRGVLLRSDPAGRLVGAVLRDQFLSQDRAAADSLVRLEAQAASAQLAMLRYQLNPHFLFNTLNSISTLVLLKQSEAANAMLIRLSSFLRHTLIAQPGGTVTVAQEVETLKLYLDIERMRFEERLKTSFRISHEAADACLPSLLLQPLVENAIKYAVSPQEEGAKISVLAQRVGNRLRVVVSDTGPGIADDVTEPYARRSHGHARKSHGVTSTGVGLDNIRNRLSQAYGDEHVFEIREPDGGGFAVTIELPYTVAGEDRETAARPASRVRDERPATLDVLAAPLHNHSGLTS